MMPLNLKGFYAGAVLVVSAFFITGCGGTNALTKSPSTTASQLTSSGSSTASSSSSSSSGSTSGPGSTSTPTPTPTPNPTPGPTPGPAPVPAGAEVIANIQNQAGWQTCGGCGNDGGTGQGPSYGISQLMASPSLSGSSADFWIHGGPSYSGGYYFIEQPTVPNPVSYLRYEFDLYLPSQAVGVPQAIEFECQQNSNGYTYNYAWQADYASNTWRVFNYTSKNWEATSVAFAGFAGGTWHHIIAIYHASGTQTVHDSITIDGVMYPVGITHDALFTGNGLEFTNAFQLDLNGNSDAYDVYVDNMTVTRAD